MRIKVAAGFMGLLFLSACGKNDIDPTVCDAVGEAKPICGINKPEDLAVLPDGKTLAVSLYGSMFDFSPGGLGLFNTATETLETLPSFKQAEADVWADVDCPGPPGEAFSPHGIDYSTRADGAGQLLVINHGERESIEFFEVAPSAGSYALTWRGCVVLPGQHFANAVVATPEGGFIFSHMFAKDAFRIGTTSWPAFKAVLGMPSGYAMEWKGSDVGGGKQFDVIGGSESGFPNGLQLSKDGRYLFLNTSVDGYVLKIDRHKGERLARSEKLPHLDNMRWDDNGYLLVASMPTGLLESVRCLEISGESNCGGAFNIVRVNPNDMSSEVVFAHPGGQPMGAGTVAVQLGSRLYMGSYAGNRIVTLPYVEGPPLQ